jgi:hypothetical protein
MTMIQKKLFVLVIAIALIACARDSAPHDRLNGRWVNDSMQVTFDFPKGTYNGVDEGEHFSHHLSLVSEHGDTVVLRSDDAVLICQLQSDGTVILNKPGPQGGIPFILHRSPG